MTNKRTLVALIAFALIALPVIAHHPAADTVDEEIYAMIDEMVADTPHADMTFDDMGAGMTEVTITSRVPQLEDLMNDGLLTYVALLDGDVNLTIDFTDRAVTLTIVQDESLADLDKSAEPLETTSLGSIKASYR